MACTNYLATALFDGVVIEVTTTCVSQERQLLLK